MPDPAPLPPTLEFLQQLWRVNHALERLSSHMERTIGVTAQQRLMIRVVGRRPGLTASALAELMHLDPGTITATVKRLEGKKLLARRSDATDKRLTRVWLTKEGEALNRPLKGTAEHAVKQLMTRRGKRELREAQRLLEKFAVRLMREID